MEGHKGRAVILHLMVRRDFSEEVMIWTKTMKEVMNEGRV